MKLKVKKSGEGHQHPAKTQVEKIITSEGTSRLNVNLPKSFYREVKTYAVSNDMNVTSLVIMALKQYMDEN